MEGIGIIGVVILPGRWSLVPVITLYAAAFAISLPVYLHDRAR